MSYHVADKFMLTMEMEKSVFFSVKIQAGERSSYNRAKAVYTLHKCTVEPAYYGHLGTNHKCQGVLII